LGIVANAFGHLLPESLRIADEVVSVTHPANQKLEILHPPDAVRDFELSSTMQVMEIEGAALVVAQGGFRTYGHFLLDVLPKIEILKRITPRPTLLVPWGLLPWQQELLSLAGVSDDDLVVYFPRRDLIRCKELFVCSQHRIDYSLHPSANIVYDALASRVASTSAEAHHSTNLRIFCARPTDEKRANELLNYKEVEDILSKRGFLTLRPEELSVTEQIELFSRAEAVVGVHGSALHNTVFSPAQTKVVSLISPETPHFAQAGVGSIRKQPTGFVFGEYQPDADEWNNGRTFTVCPRTIEVSLDTLGIR
jgi:capsular polysaccharide biosynthesis protein